MTGLYGIALDIGTSGIKGHAIELSSGKIISTAMTESHPLPGANVMDHLTFCIRMGRGLAHGMLIRSVNQLIAGLDINLGRVEKVSVCGNPTQLSIFQNMNVDDLAFPGERAQRIRGIVPQNRKSRVIPAVDVGLDLTERAELYVPPAIKHEVGADTLAMLLKSGFMEQERNCMVTDYGTNASMALKVEDDIYIGAAAVGPVIEGQYVKNGMLASPGALSDMEYEFYWRCKVLDKDMVAEEGDLIDLGIGKVISEGKMHRKARGITGTGIVAILSSAMDLNIWRKGKLRMPGGRIELQDGLFMTKKDIQEACRSIGAMRAAHFSLLEHAGIKFSELDTMYMAGASGMYVDPVKARKLGLLPPTCTNIYQVGNTSLAMATDIVRDSELLDRLQRTANEMQYTHVDFAVDDLFEGFYIQELAYWDEGMSMEMYNMHLEEAGIQTIPAVSKKADIHRVTEKDVEDLGSKGLTVVRDMDTELVGIFDGCNGCKKCQRMCPESTLKVDKDWKVHVMTKKCMGTSCYRCQYVCPQKVFKYEKLKLAE